jgi:hypothetical protein
VKLDGKLDYDLWCEGIRQGRNYVSDGLSHLIDFKVNDLELGLNGSELNLDQAGKVTLTAKVSAYLNEKPDSALQNRPYQQKPYWHLERARMDASRNVPVEVIVNGYPVAKQVVAADGELRDVTFEVPIERSSWVALRVLPSSHTNPIFVLVDGKPVRASKRSAEWCLSGVEKCWQEKEKFIKKSPIENELADAQAAYDHAREVYRKLIEECHAD